MGCCQTKKKRISDRIFHVNCSAKIKQLYDSYFQVISYLQESHFFAQPSDELVQAITSYLHNNYQFESNDISAMAVDSVHKLHPFEYKSSIVTEEWLLQACLRHQTFIDQIELELLDFGVCFYIYVQFVYLCSCNPDEVIVPSREANFVWQAHMQDHQNYQTDMMKRLGWVLNYRDDTSQQQKHENFLRTTQLRKKQYNSRDRCIVEGHYSGEREVWREQRQKFDEMKKVNDERIKAIESQEYNTTEGNNISRIKSLRSTDSGLKEEILSPAPDKKDIKEEFLCY